MGFAQLEQDGPFSRLGFPVDLFLGIDGFNAVGQVVAKDNDIADVMILVRVHKSERRLEGRAAADKVMSDAREA